MLAQTPEAVALYLACLQTGAIYTPINTAYTRREVDYFLRDAEPALSLRRREFASARSMRRGRALGARCVRRSAAEPCDR